MTKKWDRSTMRIASARYIDRQGMLDVTFQNGDHFLVAAEAVLPQLNRVSLSPIATVAATLDWGEMRISETGDVLEIPAQETVVEIPWDRIRSIADPAFRTQLADRADERARRIGGRVRAMRLEAGLTPAGLAEKAGVPRDMVTSLEAGKIEPPLNLIEQLAIALGRRLRDFAEEG